MKDADEDQAVQARRAWVGMYARTLDAGLTCRRCGISRPTLRKWWRRYQELGESGLCSQSRRRKALPEKKVTPEREQLILSLRQKRRLGPKSLQSELERHHDLKLSTATIWTVLDRHKVKPLRQPRKPEQPLRYSRLVPGDRVQIDTMQIRPRLFQFTAVDDCTRIRVLALYPARTAANAAHFLTEHVVEEFPFPVQRVQTDRGAEFFGEAFQEALRDSLIKFRPIRPRSPHLNGKVERSQQTDRLEFWATADTSRSTTELDGDLACWQHYYNWQRSHTSLIGKTPMERFFELMEKTPFSWEVAEWFQPDEERLRIRDYQLDTRIKKLKPS